MPCTTAAKHETGSEEERNVIQTIVTVSIFCCLKLDRSGDINQVVAIKTCKTVQIDLVGLEIGGMHL